jgi:hypothetical protein
LYRTKIFVLFMSKLLNEKELLWKIKK